MKKLYRSPDSKIAGICAGFGDFLDVDPTIIRIIFFVLIFTGFPIVIIYLILWLLIPKQIE